MKKILSIIISFSFIFLFTDIAISAENKYFKMDTPVMKLNEIKKGMTGEAHTVISGEKVEKFKVEIIDILNKNSAPYSLILFKILDDKIIKDGGVASGMSGSPIYISGKLIGAIGYGWSFTDGSIGLATPIEEMQHAMYWPDKTPDFYSKADLYQTDNKSGHSTGDSKKKKDVKLKEMSMPVLVDGISERMTRYMSDKLGIQAIALGSRPNRSEPSINLNHKPEPGASICVALLWGDIQAGAIGTLSAISNDNKFLAFAHPMLNRGQVAYPLTTAKILKIIPSVNNSFKLGTLGSVIGTVTQDRPEAIGGRLGVLPPVASYRVLFNDLDNHRSVEKNFKSIVDPFMSPALATSGIMGIIEDQWARTGAGTVKMEVKVTSGNMKTPWTTKNIFVSDTDALEPMLNEIESLTKLFTMNRYGELSPLGLTVTADVTNDPMVASIPEIKITPEKKEYLSGEKIIAEATVKPWRKEAYTEKFELTVPENVAQGICEIRIRGGDGASGDGAEGKLKLRDINSFSVLLEELSALETNNQIAAEFRYNKLPTPVASINGLPEEFTDTRLNSEKIKDKIKQGCLSYNETDYVIKGTLSKFIKVKPKVTNKK